MSQGKIIKTKRLQNLTEFNGVYDYQQPISVERQENILSEFITKFSPFEGWVRHNRYKNYDEIVFPENYIKNKVYIYSPRYSYTDDWGVGNYTLYGVCQHKKRILLILKNKIGYNYYEIKNNSTLIECGSVFEDTLQNYNNCLINDYYNGYRNSKWRKLDINDYQDYKNRVLKLESSYGNYHILG
jgi:hypothetical protein